MRSKNTACSFIIFLEKPRSAFEEDMQMTLILEDTLIARESQDELIEVLDKIIRERRGIQTKFDIQFVEKKESHYKKIPTIRSI